jgi:hypothetical protein
MVYCRVSNAKETAVWSTAVFLRDNRQRYGLLQCFEWRKDSGMVYCSVSYGEETAIWLLQGF